MARAELARFLRDRREARQPDEAGVPVAAAATGTARRTPGLRREEVAELASMSVDYYVRLEQARGPKPSPRILEALAGALNLDPAERAHLFRLADVVPRAPAGVPRRVRPHVRHLLDRMPDTAAVVTAADYTVLAFNPLADALLGGLRSRPNLARRRFLDRDEVLTAGHEEFGEIAVGRLRASADRYPGDGELAALLAELRAGSEEFAAVWAANPVRAAGYRTKTLVHEELGPLRVGCSVLAVPDDDQQVVFMTPEPDTASGRAFRHLAGRVAHAA
ncbi:helix-turn-helix transcriptional regulator [Catenulispora subtropica]|uniref:Helix-turn-helix transcriptional regulator n=1 Tax=Catenulispora subtropica TaxID=450798 RepID=A0ABN2S9L8_9ACTN